ncbi:trimeric intracellular cation channel family protein [Salibacterium aidingense]|uniref:trimeric intracellular cation channel family protein n=1 Tax=Salibacterium aidingense TaxID=384933 RepID=UPI00041E04B2|nr:trimeric intracellular cation channel family protein [Salibacterium aidingense]
MTWDILNMVGTIAFALSGVFVAMEEDYDLMGIYILGFVTAFGGGAIRNLLIGVPVTALWEQGSLFFIAFIIMTFAFLLPSFLFETWMKWGLLFDAAGLGSFAVQGAIFAAEMDLPLSAAIAAAALTGTGGGMIRDVLAGRKPIFLRNEIYIAWTMLAGISVGTGWIQSMPGYLLVLGMIVVCRMLSVHYGWRLPKSRWHQIKKEDRS